MVKREYESYMFVGANNCESKDGANIDIDLYGDEYDWIVMLAELIDYICDAFDLSDCDLVHVCRELKEME